jgi:hypothetical protein
MVEPFKRISAFVIEKYQWICPIQSLSGRKTIAMKIQVVDMNREMANNKANM